MPTRWTTRLRWPPPRAIEFEGPSAIIFRSPCVQLIKPAPALHVDVEKCTGCKACITSIGCPGVGFDPAAAGPKSKDRGQAFIDPSQCNGCTLCAQLCKFDAILPPTAAGEGANNA